MEPFKRRKAGSNGGAAGLTLLANGSSGPWDVSIDESAEGQDRFFAQIEGPSVYLYFQIPSLRTIAATLQFLQRRRSAPPSPYEKGLPEKDGALQIGVFGRASILLVWDTEYLDRCFLIVGVSGQPSFRLSLSGEEIAHLSEALLQVKKDLGDDGLL